MSEVSESPKKVRRFSMSNLSPEERAKKVALSYPKEDTMHWFAADNNLEEYERLLGFKRKDLEGKMVLDLGTSPTDRLAKDVKEVGINATVVGLSPDLGNLYPNEIQVPGMEDEWDRLGVAAIGQAMPFKDESFDVILGAYSVTWRAATYPEQVEAWVSEIGRVLKPGGEARLGPTYNCYGGDAMGKDMENVKKYAAEIRLAVTVNDHSEDDPEGSYILLKKLKKPDE